MGDRDPSEKFLVTVHAGDRRGNEAAPFAVVAVDDKMADFVDGLQMEFWIPDDAAFSNVFAPKLKLRLDETDDGAAAFQHRKNSGENLGQGNEGKVHDGEPDFFADVGGDHVTGVELFLDDDAGVVAEFPDELVGSDIDGVHADGSALEQAIGETAGGGTDIHTDPAGRVDLEGVESTLEFQATAADETLLFLDLERGVRRQLRAGFVDDAVPGTHFPGEDEALRLLAGITKATGNEKGVNPVFFHAMERLPCSVHGADRGRSHR